ncbi:MAG: acetyl/propionyl/methylcrotonyl-CoA carboxylase subunit alpha [Nocardioides sp.]|uniref:acetyl/propionyl/methylcrotonyl-CoA carboxylase subunit alpha n=1 Tax=Nocardioides sp. TaxID=35761 RepID=UPI003F0D3FB1
MVSTVSTTGGVLLVANRGEIARRVIRTAKALGWRTVAVHSDLDVEALHVREADEAVRVTSYLDVDAVLAAAVATGATHVHPGYGFLSERAPFARALAGAGIVLVGPCADVMDAMGRKDAAREVALAAGVPVVPSYDLDADPATFAYPVLVKAAAGGGGKGMRVVHAVEEYAEALAAARREAASSFGDDTMLVEKYVASGRHIEVQVVGDTHGTVLHFFERDCSTQRRHQKVLEEAPAPTISDAQRAAITSAAVALASQVGYTGAGTVEFLLDSSTGDFYFLEMNTRLQVEHPVTEEAVRVRGEELDLVALQLAVATGEAFGFTQDDVEIVGHAIEARVYAEDSFGGFLPQAGRATYVGWGVAVDHGVRVDHALESGQEVSTAYDPMLGKVIGYGADREAARRAVVAALDETTILGLTTNAGFLRALLVSDAFRDATIDTAWLDRTEVERPDDTVARSLAAALLVGGPESGPWGGDGWRSGGPAAPRRVLLGEWVDVPAVDRRPVTRRGHAPAGVVSVRLLDDGEPQHARGLVRGHGVELAHHGQRYVFALADPFAGDGATAGDGTLLAPMPGTVLDVRVSAGQQVAQGETLGVMEAMKMELALKAPFDGTVTEVGAATGDQVKLGARLFVVEA